MSRIAFFVQHMLCGGVENALISLASKLAENGHKVVIYVIQNKGDFMGKIPPSVSWKLIPMGEEIRRNIPVGGSKINIKECIKKREYLRALHICINTLIDKSGFVELNIPLNKIPVLNCSYDIAVNFHMHSPFLVWYLSERVQAKRKIAWIHNDFTTTSYDILKLKMYLECCQEFYGVSKKIIEEFNNIFPEYKKKAHVMYNIVPVNQILEKAQGDAPEYEQISNDYIKILSVGRLEEQKGYGITINVCKILKEAGYKFKWIILGEGTQRNTLEKAAKVANVSEELYFAGVRMNPYPYFKNCDLYVQTSLHEGYVTTVTEANIFKKPIICTNVSGAKEQIKDGINGYVTNFNPQDIASKIEIIINQGIKECENNVLEELKDSEKRSIEIFG